MESSNQPIPTPRLQASAHILAWQEELSELVAAKLAARLKPEIEAQTRVLNTIHDGQEEQSKQLQDALDGLRRRLDY
jgi:hypothetical protein